MYYFAVFAPLLGFLLSGILGPRMGDRFSQFITCTLLAFSSLASWTIFFDVNLLHHPVTLPIFTWFEVGTLSVQWSLVFDSLSSLMLAVVTTVSFVVHIYSVGYMAKDQSIPRFMAYLSLFTFMMLMLVTAENLVQLFFGWEGVGLTSYLLIGYWYKKPAANAAAIKAFLVNRVGDFGLVLGLAALFMTFNTLSIPEVLTALPSAHEGTLIVWGHSVPTLELIAVLLFVGAMGKSAQLGLHTWLPDAMEGPTPVSALIHAATMVTAGVFLLVRMSPLYELAPVTRDIVMIVGAMTAFFAGTVALTQNDIKRVIAYSTCSQLGYMFFAIGLSAYSAAMFHLTTHAFFKALLFLGAGSVIHALSDEHDMQKMGGVWKRIPLTYTMMWIGNLALAGIPFFAGFYSKSLILDATWAHPTDLTFIAFSLAIVTVFLTAFYSWRLLWLTFHGTPRASEQVMGYLHEAPTSMTIAMFILALGAIFSGTLCNTWGWFTTHAQDFWAGSVPIVDGHTGPQWAHILSEALAVSGIGIAILFYGLWSEIPRQLAARIRWGYQFLLHKWYFDELYDLLFVRPGLLLGITFWQTGDRKIIDGFGPDGLSQLALQVANRTSQIQTGYVYHYAFGMMFGVATFVIWYFLMLT
ncbi:MAG: NADH-quinone oxidoreductase subunit L [Pseudomonadota bacterium]